MEKVTFCKTNAGKGYKIAVNNTWLYVSKDLLMEVIDGIATSCQFKKIKKVGEE